jgi:hypothetical protein
MTVEGTVAATSSAAVNVFPPLDVVFPEVVTVLNSMMLKGVRPGFSRRCHVRTGMKTLPFSPTVLTSSPR